jgi:hypothetical protein
MKKILFSLLFVSFSFSAMALEIDGTYKAVRPVFSVGYTKKACIESRGKYQGDGVCLFENGGAETQIKSNERNFDIKLTSVGTNFHTCDYEGTAILNQDRKLVSNDKGTGGECELTITFKTDDTIGIEANGKCQEYCGANMYLDEETLIRSK